MMNKKGLALLLSGVLAACGGGGSSSSSSISTGSTPRPTLLTETVTITPSLGRITDATVKIYDANYENVIGEGVLDETGKVQIEVAYTRIEPTIVEVIAGDNSTYFDEAAGELALPAGMKFHAITEDPSSTAVTPLTELAWRRAVEQDDFPLDAERVKRINRAVSELFTGGLRPITSLPTVLSAMPEPNSQASTTRDLYAAMLGALAKVGESAAAPALAVLDDLAMDVSDGLVDGGNFSVRDNTVVYDDVAAYEDFAEEFRAELEAWVATYGDEAAQEAVAVMPLPGFRFDSNAALTVRQRILESEYGVGSEIAYSRAGDVEWDLFRLGEEISFHREGTLIGIAAGDNGLDPDAGEFIPGWSVDMTTAQYLDDPSVNGVRVHIPTGNPLIKRQIIFVGRGGEDLDDMILYEQDMTSGTSKLAHAPSYQLLDFMEMGVQEFFNEVRAMADNGDTLTIIISDEESRVCESAGIGVDDRRRYPKAVGLIHGVDDYEIESLEPQRIRFAKAGPQKEILFGGDTLFRINMDSGRVDYISIFLGSSVSQWATNDPALISKYCP